MTYLQYIFSDKKAAIYWIFILIALLIFPLIGLIGMSNSLPDLTYKDYLIIFKYIILYLVIYLGFYTSGYIKYKQQQRFINYYNLKIDRISTETVEIYHDKVIVKTFRQNYDAKIPVKPRFDKYKICMINRSLIILGQVYDLGIFRRHMRPIQVDLEDTNLDKFRFTSNPRINLIDFKDNDLIIRFEKSINEINKLIIKDFNKTNSH